MSEEQVGAREGTQGPATAQLRAALVPEVLSTEECLALLQEQPVGRLAVVDHGQPVIFPVNYLMDGDRVVFRTGAGSKLANASLDPVAFEVDGYDPITRFGWSVLVKGTGREITEALDHVSARERLLPVEPWAAAGELHWVRIVPREITGRRLGRPDAGGR